MAIENETSAICPIHQCPPSACPADCPNNPSDIQPKEGQTTGADSEASLEKKEYFSKEEIIEKINGIAQDEGVVPTELILEPDSEKYNANGNLLSLTIKMNRERAQEKGSGNIWYMYNRPTILTTPPAILRAESLLDTPNEVYFAIEALEFKDGVWVKP